MVLALVSVERVKEALHIDGSGDDVRLASDIAAASAAVVNYLKDRAAQVLNLDGDGELQSGSEVPPEVELATIVLVGHYYREPDGDSEKAFEHGYLPRPVIALLYPLRDPALR